MRLEIPASLGEVMDKISILKIKNEMITDPDKLKEIRNEEAQLTKRVEEQSLELGDFLDQLLQVNRKLWKIEDDIRDLERKGQFDKEFIELARSVYITNDQRFDIKNRINLKFGSDIKEVKSYEKY
ncbi:MAG: septal ring factor EnvC (AmiA/AmiB activator) [Bacteriovoracaceae bacterium]|jgi:septal ring factor EnvC (AmiA/AmiB activator)